MITQQEHQQFLENIKIWENEDKLKNTLIGLRNNYCNLLDKEGKKCCEIENNAKIAKCFACSTTDNISMYNMNVKEFFCQKCYDSIRKCLTKRNRNHVLHIVTNIIGENRVRDGRVSNIVSFCWLTDKCVYEQILDNNDFPVYCDPPKIGKKFKKIERSEDLKPENPEKLNCSFCKNEAKYGDRYLNYCESCKVMMEDGEYDITPYGDDDIGKIIYSFLKDWINKNYWQSINAEQFYEEYGALHKGCSICKKEMLLEDEIAVTYSNAAHSTCAENIGFPPLSYEEYRDIIENIMED